MDIVNKTFTHSAEEEECKGSVGYFYQADSSFFFCPKGASFKKPAFLETLQPKERGGVTWQQKDIPISFYPHSGETFLSLFYLFSFLHCLNKKLFSMSKEIRFQVHHVSNANIIKYDRQEVLSLWISLILCSNLLDKKSCLLPRFWSSTTISSRRERCSSWKTRWYINQYFSRFEKRNF